MIAPILLLLLIGSIEIGRGLRDYHVVNESVRDAARYLSRVVATCPGGGAAGSLTAADLDAGRALAMTGDTDAAPPPGSDLLDYWKFPADKATVAVTVTCLANGGQFQGLYLGDPEVPVIDVVATVPFTFLFGEFVVPDGTINFQLAHRVVNVAKGL